MISSKVWVGLNLPQALQTTDWDWSVVSALAVVLTPFPPGACLFNTPHCRLTNCHSWLPKLTLHSLSCEFGAVMFPAVKGPRSCRSSGQLPPAVPLWSPLHPYSNASCLQQLQLLWEVQVSDLQALIWVLEEKSLLTHLRGLSLSIPSSIAIPSYLSLLPD